MDKIELKYCKIKQKIPQAYENAIFLAKKAGLNTNKLVEDHFDNEHEVEAFCNCKKKKYIRLFKLLCILIIYILIAFIVKKYYV